MIVRQKKRVVKKVGNMLAEKIRNNYRTVANLNDLERIVGNIRPELKGTGGLHSRAKRSYFCFAELASMGFTSVRVPIAAWAGIQWRCFGQTRSISTIQRSFKELEDQGFITRRNFRRGDISDIVIHTEKFKFYCAKNSRYIKPPVYTYTDTQLHRSFCDSYEFTDTYSFNKKVDSCSDTNSMKSKKHAKSFKDWIHPLIFTLGVLWYDRGKAAREEIQQAALRAINDKVPPFDFWTWERWQEMSKPAREREARKLIPILEDRMKIEADIKKKNLKTESLQKTPVETRAPKTSKDACFNIPKPENLDKFFTNFAERMSIKIGSPQAPPNDIKTEKIEKISEKVPSLLTASELEILQWANKNKLNRNE